MFYEFVKKKSFFVRNLVRNISHVQVRNLQKKNLQKKPENVSTADQQQYTEITLKRSTEFFFGFGKGMKNIFPLVLSIEYLTGGPCNSILFEGLKNSRHICKNH